MPTDSFPAALSVTPIPAFNDNYIWCLHNEQYAVVVDPGDADPVLAFCKDNELALAAILITHHHHDHTGGITKLSSAVKDLPVIGPRGGHISGITKSVAQGDLVKLPLLDCEFNVLELPGHTLDHIAFVGHNALFCGDTLFSAGCGRLFEGTPGQMHRSLNKIKRLPASTVIYCTHEYTQANVNFALAAEPDNQALQAYDNWVKETRAQNTPTLPTLLSTQLDINPFLRCDSPAIKKSVASQSDAELIDEIAVFTHLRQWKDNF
ncbi:MAG: hydroxyacylglutathione hydrolase [Pseudomonadota bacterium]|uniref:Hydroxyacylglutathione hydrolase n=1 Tax=Alteromonas alba TaxID=2079529 RepID=A0A2S9V6Z5_9ALTE|nr:hydroxyacylglutathione hydrolase [Alteromonas alba]MCP4863873.1 hydroxyacylglutathione hydrolase [Alteromonas sp.]MDY6928887.1 hydroxyacylglutathione hydrolase [Pseudomonadota bacterium]PRO72227.1 hydroxyacylglutathione hydrolase [Alteromonas alba]